MNRQSVLLPVLAVLFPSIAHLSAEPVESAVRVAPAILAKDEQARLGIGELWSELSFIGEDGKPRSLTEFRDKTVVLAVRDLDCPVSRNYAPRLAALEKEFPHLAGSEVLVIHLFPGDAKSPAELRKELTEHGHTGVMARDPDGSLSRALRLRTTSEVFVFDRSRTLRYRGAIDDQYGIGYRKDSPRTHYPARCGEGGD
jgi:hypothetical protein